MEYHLSKLFDAGGLSPPFRQSKAHAKQLVARGGWPIDYEGLRLKLQCTFVQTPQKAVGLKCKQEGVFQEIAAILSGYWKISKDQE